MRYILILFIFLSLGSFANTYVVTNTHDSGPGSLRYMIAQGSDGDTVALSPQLLWNGSDTIHLYSPIEAGYSLTIIGAMNATDTIHIDGGGNSSFLYNTWSYSYPRSYYLKNLSVLNCNNGGRFGGAIYLISEGEVVVESCTFVNCKVDSFVEQNQRFFINGGALFIRESVTSRIEDCRFVGCQAANGGALHVGALDSIVIKGCDFIENEALFTGGAVNVSQSQSGDADVSIENCSFLRNISNTIDHKHFAYGGALLIVSDSAYIGNTSFIDNVVAEFHPQDPSDFSEGGAIVSHTRRLTCESLYFANNNAEIGGAMWIFGGIDITNSTFENNTAGWMGGGAYFRITGYDSQVRNCTFTRNSAVVGGALGGYDNYGASESLDITNCTFYENHSDSTAAALYLHQTLMSNLSGCLFVENTSQFGPGVVSNGYMSSGGFNAFEGVPSFGVASDRTGVTKQDAALNPLVLSSGNTPTMRPSKSSVLIDVGNPNDTSYCQDGPILGVRDIGATEGAIIVIDSVLLCDSVQWWGDTYYEQGVYREEAISSSGLDSIGILYAYDLESSLLNINGTLTVPSMPSATYQWIRCNSSGIPIVVGQTSSTFRPTSNGVYAVVITMGNCTDTSDCYPYREVSLEEQIPHFKIFPNPATYEVVIESEFQRISHVRLYSVLGRIVMVKADRGNRVILDVSSLEPGVWICEITSVDGDRRSEKIIISR
ncbi:MAG: T9SS type A sorting domain-containing protein [Bacteroidetes bacterium]|nr:MAG: T9SS type A sorting domain-containing protein [Bacteroidota bacterium]